LTNVMKRRCCFALVVVLTIGAVAGNAAHANAAATRHVVLEQIGNYRQTTWRFQSLMGVQLTPTRYGERTGGSAYARWVRNLWRSRAAKAWRQVANPPHESAWRCLQRYEAPWGADTGNGFYGGLQMDVGFQQHYGSDLLRRKGLAHRWTPYEQMWVAERALRAGRGFYPWPNTARI
jgi:hypothetical protein